MKFKKNTYVVLLECENIDDIDSLMVNHCYKIDRSCDPDTDCFSVLCDSDGESSEWGRDDMGEYKLRAATEAEISYYIDNNDQPYDVSDILKIDPNNRKAYISCPIGEPLPNLEKVKETLRKVGYEPYHWVRDTKYQPDIFDNCGIFVLMIDEGNQEKGWISVDVLPAGCKKELAKARELKKMTYLAYKMSRGWRIYKIRYDESDDTFSVVEDNYLKFTEIPVIQNYSIY